MLRFAPALTLAFLLGPVGVGLLWTLLPAFGYLPAIGAHEFSLKGWRDLLAFPGFATSLRLTLATGLGATALSLLLALGFCALASTRPSFRAAERLLAPLARQPARGDRARLRLPHRPERLPRPPPLPRADRLGAPADRASSRSRTRSACPFSPGFSSRRCPFSS